jgi:hypothetical protein
MWEEGVLYRRRRSDMRKWPGAEGVDDDEDEEDDDDDEDDEEEEDVGAP